jgi:prevent-host-death family protein
MYMITVGVAELRQNLSKYLSLVADGQRIVVTDHNRPVAELGPLPSRTSRLERLIAAGTVEAPRDSAPPVPDDIQDDTYVLSNALDAVRGDR